MKGFHGWYAELLVTNKYFPFAAQDTSIAEYEEPKISLPYEILLKIFKYLQPKELCRCAQVSKFWSVVAMDTSLWFVLHPSKWGRGDFTFGQQRSSNDYNCDCEPNYNMLEFRE